MQDIVALRGHILALTFFRFSLLFLLLGVMSACSSQLSEDEFVAEARRLALDNDAKTLEILSKNYLESQPESAIGREYLGVAYTQMGDYQQALFQFNRIDFIPHDPSNLSHLLETAYMTSIGDDMDEVVSSFLSVELPPAEAFVALSMVDFDQWQRIFAANSSAAVLINSFFDAQAKNDVSTFLTKLKSPEARAFFADTPWFYHGLLADLSTRYADPADAIAHLKTLNRLRPKHHVHQLNLISVLVTTGKLNEAQALISPMLGEFEQQPLLNYFQAIIDYADNDLLKARGHIEIAINNGYNTRNAYLLAGALDYNLGNHESALASLKRVQLNPATESIYTAMLRNSARIVGDADVLSQLVLATDIENQADLLNTERQLKDIQRIAGNAYTRQLVSKLSLGPEADQIVELSVASVVGQATGNTEASVQLSEQILATEANAKENPNLAFRAMLVVIQELARRGQFDLMETRLKTAMQRFPEDDRYLLLLADLYKARQDQQSFDAALGARNNSQSVIYQMLRGDYELEEKNYAKAKQYFFTALQQRPLSVRLQQRLAYAALNDSTPLTNAQIDSIYRPLSLQAEQQDKSATQKILISHSLLLSMLARTDDAARLLTNYLKQQPDVGVRYLYNTSETLLKAGDQSAALDVASKLLKDTPPLADRSLMLSIASLGMRLNAATETLTFVDGQLPYHPQEQQLKLFKAELLLSQERYVEAQSMIKALSQNNPSVLSISAKIEYALGNLNLAIKQWQQAYELQPTEETALWLYTAYRANDQLAKGAALVESYLSSIADSFADALTESTSSASAIGARLALADAYRSEQLSKPEEAIQLYKQVLAAQPTHRLALNNLAWDLFQLGDHEQADEIIQTARDVYPNDAAIHATFQRIQRRSNE